MTAPEVFTVTPRSRPSVRFPTLEEAHAFAKKLLHRDSVPSIVTDSTGQACGTYDLFLDPVFEGGRAVPGVYTAEQAAR